MVPNASGDAMGLVNPQINPMILNQIIAATQSGGGLYLPHQPMQPQQQQQQQQPPPPPQQQQQQVNDADIQSRRSRPAAIPIKPPPGNISYPDLFLEWYFRHCKDNFK